MPDHGQLLARLGLQPGHRESGREGRPVTQVGLGSADRIDCRAHLSRDRPKDGAGARILAVSRLFGGFIDEIAGGRLDRSRRDARVHTKDR